MTSHGTFLSSIYQESVNNISKRLSSDCSWRLRYNKGGLGARAMNPRFKEIIDGLPDKPPRSRLEPYYELVKELRRRGRTYRDIAQILAENCQLEVTASGIHAFVRRRSRAKRRPGKRSNLRRGQRRVMSAIPRTVTATPNSASATSSGDEVARKIAALKARKLDENPRSERFQFDANEPLRLKKPEKSKSE